jgi:alpha-glucosidase (family GH31 glycosyl hydrolase)
MKLRYRLIPYIYSYEHQRRETGVGLVRPLLFDWPQDPQVRDTVDSWMFGDWLMVSPIVAPMQSDTSKNRKSIYYPAGTWTDWRWGATHQGGKAEDYEYNNKWTDVPLFIRQGAIIPMMREDVQYVGEKPLEELDVEVYPDTKRTSFEYYDDDGKTYDYETGIYFSQLFSVQKSDGKIEFETAAPEGSYLSKPKSYLVKIYGSKASAVAVNGQPVTSFSTLDGLRKATGTGWASDDEIPAGREGSKRPVTYIRINAGEKQNVVLTTQ